MDYKDIAHRIAWSHEFKGHEVAQTNAIVQALTEAHAAGVKEGEANLAEERRDNDPKHKVWRNLSKRCEEAEAKLYDTEVKRGQDIMEFEREKKALTAELADGCEKMKKAKAVMDAAQACFDRNSPGIVYPAFVELLREMVMALSPTEKAAPNDKCQECGHDRSGHLHDGLGLVCEGQIPPCSCGGFEPPEKPAPEVKP